MNIDISLYKKLFEKSGYTFTIQKKIVLLEIINSNTHLSAKDIYDKVKERNVGLATVYRALRQFSELGIVKEINMDTFSYYEIKIFSGKPLHIHFKCSECDSIIDVDSKDLNLEYIKLNKRIEEEMNLEINDVNIMLLGICNRCKGDKNA